MQARGGQSGDVEIASTSRRGEGQPMPLPMPMPMPMPMPKPKPRTPPRIPDIHGKYRKQAELNHLDHQISMLEEELKSLEGLSPASRCCKEVEEFVNTHPDPLLTSTEEVQRSFRYLKILDMKCQSTSACCCCFKHHSVEKREHSVQKQECSVRKDASFCSCNFFKSWRCSCWKLSCKSRCKIPSLSCGKCSCMGCFRCVKCCHPCRRK